MKENGHLPKVDALYLKQEGRMEGGTSLPSSDEIREVFRDYRQVLRETSFLTPLQRCQRLATRTNSVHLMQRKQATSIKVHSLLPPGLHTRHNVDFLRLLCLQNSNIPLRIPVTLLSQAQGCVLMKTGEAGAVRVRTFGDREKGLAVMVEEIRRAGLVRSPEFVYRRDNEKMRVCRDWEAAANCWRADSTSPQMLQQYMRSSSRTSKVLRVHWKESQTKPDFYYLASRPESSNKCFLPGRCSLMSRSLSDISLAGGLSSVQIVQNVKSLSEVIQPLEMCLKVLHRTLEVGEKLAEVVCDFILDSQRQWVFLACKGLTFTCKRRLQQQEMEPSRPITLKFLLYPVVARRSVIQARLQWSNKLKEIAAKQHLSVEALMDTLHDYTELPSDTPKAKEVVPLSPPLVVKPRVIKLCRESEILAKEVGRYEQIRTRSKLFRKEASHQIDFTAKHGVQVWRNALITLTDRLQTLETELFFDRMSFDEMTAFVNALMRVIRGDYNLYYKEVLRKVHQRQGISKSSYQLFLQELQVMLRGVTPDRNEAVLIHQRFLSLQDYICTH